MGMGVVELVAGSEALGVGWFWLLLGMKGDDDGEWWLNR